MRVAINGDNITSLKNRRSFFNKINSDQLPFVACDLVHGTNIKVVSKKQACQIIIACDGLVTREKNLILTVTAADCLPIYFIDTKNEAVGLVHAGWRGVYQNISFEMIKKMKKLYRTNPKDLLVIIGPYIKQCHFDLSPELAAQFFNDQKYLGQNRVKVDLGDIVRNQLAKAGVAQTNIKLSDDCTFCNKKYYSNRRDNPKTIEAMMAYIYIK